MGRRSDLQEFAKLAVESFDDVLLDRGFQRISRKIERNSFRVDYRSGVRYVSIRASTDPRDDPPCFSVLLGEGSLDWPEADWNAIALWRLRNFLAHSDEAAAYVLGEAPVGALIERATAELLEYGADFLAGDTKSFRQARSIQNKDRQPYRIHEPDGRGGYRTRIDPESAKIKERFSQE